MMLLVICYVLYIYTNHIHACIHTISHFFACDFSRNACIFFPNLAFFSAAAAVAAVAVASVVTVTEEEGVVVDVVAAVEVEAGVSIIDDDGIANNGASVLGFGSLDTINAEGVLTGT